MKFDVDGKYINDTGTAKNNFKRTLLREMLEKYEEDSAEILAVMEQVP